MRLDLLPSPSFFHFNLTSGIINGGRSIVKSSIDLSWEEDG